MRFSGRPSFFNVTDNAVADAAEFTFQRLVGVSDRPPVSACVGVCATARQTERGDRYARARGSSSSPPPPPPLQSPRTLSTRRQPSPLLRYRIIRLSQTASPLPLSPPLILIHYNTFVCIYNIYMHPFPARKPFIWGGGRKLNINSVRTLERPR